MPSVKLPGKLARLPRKAIYAGAGAVALLLVMYVGAKLLFSGASAFASDLRFLPSNCAAIGSARMDEIVKSPLYQDVLTQVKAAAGKDDPTLELEQTFGLSLNDLVRVTFGVADNGKDGAIVVTTNKPVTAGDLKGKLKRNPATLDIDSEGMLKLEPVPLKEVKVGSYTMHQEDDEISERAFCIVDPNTIVYGEPGPLKAILERDKKADLSADMQAALDQVDQARPLFVAVNVKGLMAGAAKDWLKGLEPPVADDLGGVVPPDRSRAPGLGPMAALVGKVDMVTLDAAIGTDTQLSVVVVCQDSGVADEIRKAADGLRALGKLSSGLPPDLVKLIDGVKITASGTKVTGTAAIPSAMLAMAVDATRPQKVKFQIIGRSIDGIDDDMPAKPKGPPIVVKAEALTKEYHTNREAANQKYTRKPLEIEGQVHLVLGGEEFVAVVLLQGFKPDEQTLMSVECKIAPNSIPQARSLKTGDKVKIRGECLGLTAPTVVTVWLCEL